MAWERENACVGCAECIGCGRKTYWWNQCYCDICGAPVEDTGYLDEGRELCAACAAEAMFCANVEEDRRDYVRQCMATEGYDTSVVDDVIEWLDIPVEKRFNCFDAVGEVDF